MDNAFEGVYLDDMIIGFAERGEMVTNANANTTFVSNTELLNPALPGDHVQITQGPYQLEIRRSSDYGISDPPPVPYIVLTRSFDTNDRLSQEVQIVAPAGEAIAEAETFSLYDGVNRVTFEFDDLSINNGAGDGVAPGNVRFRSTRPTTSLPSPAASATPSTATRCKPCCRSPPPRPMARRRAP